jgi:phosphosulfolactate synthase (CoM biosynthesis protein A)
MSDTGAGTDIAELFARDPLQLTRKDVKDIVDVLRNARHQFNSGNMQAGNMKVSKKAAETAKAAKELGLDAILDDI